MSNHCKSQCKSQLHDCCSELWDDLSEARKHVLYAKKELLLAVRAGIDVLLEKTEHHSHNTNSIQKVTIK